MPWSPDDAPRKTKRATTAKLRELWARVANDELDQTGDEGLAVRSANAAVRRAADHNEMEREAKRK